MIDLRVLGAIDVAGAIGEGVQDVVRQPKRLALLAYLAIESRRHFARRDSLLAMFWPELGDERARHALRQALHGLRRSLGADLLQRRGDDDLGLNRDALACDAATFESLLDDGRGEEALAIYRGELLPGVFVSGAPAFERWLDETRERLRARAVDAARSLERAAVARADTPAAVAWMRRVLALSPHDEPAMRRLLTHLEGLGERARAVEAYDAFARRLATDLELQPSVETQAAAHQIRDQVAIKPAQAAQPRQLPAPAASPPAVSADAPAGSPWRRAGPVTAIAAVLLAAAIIPRVSSTPASLGGLRQAGDTSVAPLKATIARRLYDEALSAWTRGDMASAERLSIAAYQQDSSFALALFTNGVLVGYRAEFDEALRLQRRAVAMAPQQPDHDRLLVLTWFAHNYSDPRFAAFAETLAIRYPNDLQGQWFVAQGRRFAGDYLGSLAPLRHMIEVDRRSLRGTVRTRCFACRAFPELVSSLENLDSLPRAEAAARDWIRESPRDPDAWGQLVYQLTIQGRYAEALSAQQRKEDVGRLGTEVGIRGEILLRVGDFDTYERILLERLDRSGQVEANDTRWHYWFLLRNEGRMREALTQPDLMRGESRDEALAGLQGLMRAQSYDETGQFARAAQLWDSMANNVSAREPPAQAARFRSWIRARMSDPVSRLRDTATLKWLADTIRADGQRSGFGRDRRLYHHVLGLLAEVRGDFGAACDHFRDALISASPAYPRTNIAIGRTCIAAGRPLDAWRPLYGALHGPIGAQGTYATMTEVYEQLGALHDALGRPDSARYWFGRSADAWKRADPAWLARPDRRAAIRTASSARPASRDRQD